MTEALEPMHPAAFESKTKTEVALQTIRLNIDEGVYKPGERLQVNTLAEGLRMSPTPIREAFRLLEAEGLIEHTPHLGVRVSSISEDTLIEVYALRTVLEPLAARLAAEHATDEQIADMRSTHEELKRVHEENPAHSRLVELNRLFHWAVYEAAGSKLLLEFIRRLWTAVPVNLGWRQYIAAHSIAEHGQILAAIERHDRAGAESLMRSHIEPAVDRLRRFTS